MAVVRSIVNPIEAKNASLSAKIPTIGYNKLAAPPMDMKKKRIPNEKILFFLIVPIAQAKREMNSKNEIINSTLEYPTMGMALNP